MWRSRKKIWRTRKNLTGQKISLLGVQKNYGTGKKNLTVQEKIWRSDISPWRPKYFTLTDYFKILTGHPFQTDSPRPDKYKWRQNNKWAWTIHRESNFIRSFRITQKFQTPQNDLHEHTNNSRKPIFCKRPPINLMSASMFRNDQFPRKFSKFRGSILKSKWAREHFHLKKSASEKDSQIHSF